MDLLISAIQGDGNCAKVIWQFLGISIPGWVLISLIGLSTYLLISLKKLKTSL
jgi:disulfide bond formation protein DsbB